MEKKEKEIKSSEIEIEGELKSIIEEATFSSTMEKEYKITKEKLESYIGMKKSVWTYLLFAIIGLFISIGYLWYIYESSWKNEIEPLNIVISICVFILVATVLTVYWNMIISLRITALKEALIRNEVYGISKEVEEDIYESSIKMSYKYLDEYYLQTRSQAQKGFYITVGIAIGGALLIGIGIVAMFLEATQPSYVTTASGVITEFVAAIFFYLYNRTIQSMNSYHDKLVLSQNISIALKLSESLDEDIKSNAKNEIIRELIKDINLHIKNDAVWKETVGSQR